MNNPLKSEIDVITAQTRRNPVHILRWRAKEEALKKTPELFLRHKTFFTEDFVFEPDEEIMVYADFTYPSPPLAPDEPPEFGGWPMHRHEFFEMFYVYSGVCTCEYEDQVFNLPPGSLCVLNTRCRHRLLNISDGLVYNIMVRRRMLFSDMFTMLKGNDLFLNFFINSVHGDNDRPSIMLFNIEQGEIAEIYLFSLLREYYRTDSRSQDLMKLMYGSLLVELSRKYKDTDREKSGMTEIMSYISDHWNSVTLASLAKALHYSPSNLSRFFQRNMGRSFSDYLRSFRLDRAAHFLLHTDLGIEKVAEMCGYGQRSSFEKEFKKYTGKTPKEYRRNTNNRQL